MSLFPEDVALKPTPAMNEGRSCVAMCSWCGLLACATELVRLKACPACGSLYWWEQTLPVGPFRYRKPERELANAVHRTPKKGRATFVPYSEEEDEE